MQKLKSWLIAFIVIASIAWSIYDWTKLHLVVTQLHHFAWVALILSVSEALFIGGAVIMAVQVGELAGEQTGWIGHVRHARSNVRRVVSQSLQSRWFGIGFWINFAGALTTTGILAVGVVLFMPKTSWGLLLLLVIDLISTIGWRLPVHAARRRQRMAA